MSTDDAYAGYTGHPSGHVGIETRTGQQSLDYAGGQCAGRTGWCRRIGECPCVVVDEVGLREGADQPEGVGLGQLIELDLPSQLDFDFTTLPSSPATTTPSALRSPFPFLCVCLPPTCCRQRGLPPQWPSEVRARRPSTCPRPRANSAISQTRDGPAALPRCRRRLHIVHLVQQCDARTAEPGTGRRCPRNAAADEAGAARSAIAEPGGEEGSDAVCPVRDPSHLQTVPCCTLGALAAFTSEMLG